MFEVTFVLPGLISSGGVRAVLEISDRLRDFGRSTAIVVPKRSLLSPKRSVVGIGERLLPASTMPFVQRLARERPVSQSWFPLQTPVFAAEVPLWRDIPQSRAVVATSWRTAEEVSRSRDSAERGVYFLQGYETWSGPARRVDATWRAYPRMVVSSEWLREMARSRFGRTDVHLAVYGVDLDVFRPVADPEPRPVPVIGFMHDDRPLKGAADMLSALSSVRSGRDVKVMAFGLGTKPLPAWVNYLGRLSGHALAEFYRSIDVFVSASWTETGPMTVPEAMACGAAVVTTDVGNVRIWSDEGRFCRIVPPREPSALASAIEAMIEDPAERSRMSGGGREMIRNFTWERTARDFEKALLHFGLLEE